MGNLTHYAGSGSGSGLLHTNPDSPGDAADHSAAADGYASEDFVPGSSSSCRERKKGSIFSLKWVPFVLVGLDFEVFGFVCLYYWDSYLVQLSEI